MNLKKIAFGGLRTAAVASLLTGGAVILTSTSGCSDNKCQTKCCDKKCGGENKCGGEKKCGGDKKCGGSH